MLELIDLAVSRGSTPVVRGLTAAVTPGRVFWVTGPNGSGKTSLLRVLAGIDPPSAGRISDRRPPGEPLLYVHSEMGLPAASTVGDWERLARRVLPGTGRTPLWPPVPGRRRIRRLSTGERKRILLDVALRRDGALLLDEPFEHLSPDAKGVLSGLLEERARRVVVVVATNQVGTTAGGDGLRLEGGTAMALPTVAPGPAGGAVGRRVDDAETERSAGGRR